MQGAIFGASGGVGVSGVYWRLASLGTQGPEGV